MMETHRVQEGREIEEVASVPTALLEPGSPLRRAGMSEEGVVLVLDRSPGWIQSARLVREGEASA
jgi:hypothetical protein